MWTTSERRIWGKNKPDIKQQGINFVCSCTCILIWWIFIYWYIFTNSTHFTLVIDAGFTSAWIFIFLAVCHHFAKVYKAVANYVRKCYLFMLQIKRLRKRIMAWYLTCVLTVIHISVIQIKNRCGYLALHWKGSCKPDCKLSQVGRIIEVRICSWIKTWVAVEAPWLPLVFTYSICCDYNFHIY